MKRIVLSLVLILLFSTVSFANDKKITVGVSPVPHKDIMLVVKELLKKDGYELILKEFSDYVLPNIALSDGALDANFFQHIPYLENMNKEKNLGLAWVAKIHIEPLGLYSSKIKSLDELKKGHTVAVPNDPTNEARALRLLAENGIISLKDGELVTVKDITANPKSLKFMELEAAQLPRVLQDVTAAVINTNFAAAAKLNPAKDAIIIESKESPYANVVVVQLSKVDTSKIKALIKASQSPEVKAYIEEFLVPRGMVPAF